MSQGRLASLLGPSVAAPSLLEGLPPGGLAYLLALPERPPQLQVVVADDARAQLLGSQAQALGLADVCILQGGSVGAFEHLALGASEGYGRQRQRQRLLAGRPPALTIIPVAVLQMHWAPAEAFLAGQHSLRVGDQVDREALAVYLLSCGFQAVSVVEDEGTFAVRGGVVDIFVPGDVGPVRLDLFGDELVSLHHVRISDQRNLAALACLDLYPLRDVIFAPATMARATQHLQSLAEHSAIPSRRLRQCQEEIAQHRYFFGIEALWPIFYPSTEPAYHTLLGADGCVCVDDADAVAAAIQQHWQGAAAEHQEAVDKHQLVAEVEQLLVPPEAMQAALAARVRLASYPALLDTRRQPRAHGLVAAEPLASALAERRQAGGPGAGAGDQAGGMLRPLVQALQRATGAGEQFWLTASSLGQAEKLREMLRPYRLDLPQVPVAQALATGYAGALTGILVAPLPASFTDTVRGVTFVSDVDIWGVPQRPAAAGRRSVQGIGSLRQMQVGDCVIHQAYGIGRYLGLKRLVLSGIDGDYLHLEYADGDKLYIPVYNIGILQRYRGPTEQVRLDKLGGARWLRAKQRVKDSVLALAHTLLSLQAQRQARPGFALGAPDADYTRFAAAFPYEETPDQQRAIDDVVADLQRATPMDRLICGDVGFGKTEVAVRAAYLAVRSGYQVAVLVPTTVLAEQHQVTFAERLAGDGVQVEVFSRFRRPQEIRRIRDAAAAGQVDVLIGTHRLLSGDVRFKNLGLLVVDEEQRFGVRHKERIKQLRQQVHVLTLSATPIPRTMHMASLGLRDLSIIATPPLARTPVRTEILPFDEDVIATALRRELQRGGQAFVVHNRVQSIAAMANLVQRLVPDARVAVAHGQMQPEQLEKVMVQFIRRDYQVLICTAIIESGIDIPAVNTLIINRADQFGLSQLYQLRGRIGRGRQRAYAYLMLPANGVLAADARQRLGVLKRFTELGSGFQVASHDLELRGAGDLLGSDQSGSIAAVGFELYTELLSEAVEQARGQAAPPPVEPEIKLPVVAILPESYVPDPIQRLAIYQRLAAVADDAQIFDIYGELTDMYGPAPTEVTLLAEVMVIRRRLLALGITHLNAALAGAALRVGLTFAPGTPVDLPALVQRCQTQASRYRLLPPNRLAVVLDLPSAAQPLDALRLLRAELAELARS